MKAIFAIAVATVMFAATPPATAEDQPTLKAPTKTMGDTGTLPATGTVTNKVPEMGATEPMTNTGSHTMGDTGTLPATGARLCRRRANCAQILSNRSDGGLPRRYTAPLADIPCSAIQLSVYNLPSSGA